MKKEYLLVIILAVIIIVLTVIILWPTKPVWKEGPLITNYFSVSSPKSNGEVSSPLKITGVVNGNGWTGFEGQVGTVKLLDYKGNELGSAVLTATTEWTVLPVSFQTTLTFIKNNSGPATLVFHNENPSGMPEKDKTFSLPVKIK